LSAPDKSAVESSIEAREQEQDNIDAQQEQGIHTPQASVREQELEDELARLRQQLAAATKQPAKAPKPAPYKVPKGEEAYTHARITMLSGVKLTEPVVKAFHADQYEQISKTPGFEAEVVHQGQSED
jgi:phosphoenolpyruvate-protein kinase (PTS system EI component)